MTSTHSVDREEVMAWIDGELSTVRAAEVTTHVASCAECRSLAGSFQQLSTDLASWHVGSPPQHLTAASLRLPAREGGAAGPRVPWSWLAGRTRFGVPRWIFAAAPAFVFLFIAVLWPNVERNPPLPMATATVGNRFGGGGGGGGRGMGGMSTGQGRGPAGGGGGSPTEAPPQVVGNGPMIARTASIALVTDRFDDMRPSLERLAAVMKGSIAELRITGDVPNQRMIRGSLRVPADRFDDALAGIRRLGKVTQESQSSEDVGDAHRDLVVRIANAKTEEGRLNQLLARTGRLSDVLDVEREVTRVRGEIERMAAEELSMRNRVQFSTIGVEIREAYRAEIALDSMPLSTRLRNALVDGCRDAAASVLETILVMMRNGPTLIVWALVIGGPIWWTWRRSRRRISE